MPVAAEPDLRAGSVANNRRQGHAGRNNIFAPTRRGPLRKRCVPMPGARVYGCAAFDKINIYNRDGNFFSGGAYLRW
ncbi:hypothetical protein MIZ01_2311 [Sideroxyarcus emersonii]|uniref:Uncharacterized protein n=1 Tax=Sideroxyarcus emersonii TaxID=2764705 RepID=A0AAN2C058_9PROT|nr:hypothetical protein MIZ01_2311 [Sideroxyarcus emersonii]